MVTEHEWRGLPPYKQIREYEQMRDRQAEVKARLESIGRKIDRRESLDLEALARAGVERKTLVRLLAWTADSSGDRDWPELMRECHRTLKSLSERMEALATDANKAVPNPLLRVNWWAYLFGYGALLGMEKPGLWKDIVGVPSVVSGMRALGRMWNEEAKRFHAFLLLYGRKDSQAPIALFLLNVYLLRRRKDHIRELDHFDALARLLTDTFEAAKVEKKFSADQLRQVWKRRGKRLLSIWFKLLKAPR